MRNLLKFGNRFRRVFMKTVNRGYIKNKSKKRKGFCKRCGQCCKGCNYFKEKNCIIYKNRPWWCHKDFPIDKLDQKVFGVKNCGFKFR